MVPTGNWYALSTKMGERTSSLARSLACVKCAPNLSLQLQATGQPHGQSISIHYQSFLDCNLSRVKDHIFTFTSRNAERSTSRSVSTGQHPETCYTQHETQPTSNINNNINIRRPHQSGRGFSITRSFG